MSEWLTPAMEEDWRSGEWAGGLKAAGSALTRDTLLLLLLLLLWPSLRGMEPYEYGEAMALQ